MNELSIKRIHRIYSILLSIVLIIAGLCLMFSCIDIYKSGKQTFSREAVANAFSKISIPIYICIFLTILGFLLDLFLPNVIGKGKVNLSKDMLLKNIQNKKDLSQCEIDIVSAVTIERKKRRLHSALRMVVIFISGVVFLAYALDSDHFHQTDINGSMIKAMLVLIPCLFISFAYSLFTVIINEKSMFNEIELLKKLPTKERLEADELAYSNDKKITVIRFLILIFGIGILVYGFYAGGTRDVLTKAVNICTECIGLG